METNDEVTTSCSEVLATDKESKKVSLPETETGTTGNGTAGVVKPTGSSTENSSNDNDEDDDDLAAPPAAKRPRTEESN